MTDNLRNIIIEGNNISEIICIWKIIGYTIMLFELFSLRWYKYINHSLLLSRAVSNGTYKRKANYS